MRITQILRAAIIGQLAFSFLMASHATAKTLIFPAVEETNEVDEILDLYPVYLRFVLGVGQTVDRRSAERLHKNYLKLVKYDRDGAASFLKGLRFEMHHKMELMSAPPRAMTTASPEMRRWVKRFIGEWAREADEYLFRSVAARAAERNRRRAD